jgi:hypothetical protein
MEEKALFLVKEKWKTIVKLPFPVCEELISVVHFTRDLFFVVGAIFHANLGSQGGPPPSKVKKSDEKTL